MSSQNLMLRPKIAAKNTKDQFIPVLLAIFSLLCLVMCIPLAAQLLCYLLWPKYYMKIMGHTFLSFIAGISAYLRVASPVPFSLIIGYYFLNKCVAKTSYSSETGIANEWIVCLLLRLYVLVTSIFLFLTALLNYKNATFSLVYIIAILLVLAIFAIKEKRYDSASLVSFCIAISHLSQLWCSLFAIEIKELSEVISYCFNEMNQDAVFLDEFLNQIKDRQVPIKNLYAAFDKAQLDTTNVIVLKYFPPSLGICNACSVRAWASSFIFVTESFLTEYLHSPAVLTAVLLHESGHLKDGLWAAEMIVRAVSKTLFIFLLRCSSVDRYKTNSPRIRILKTVLISLIYEQISFICSNVYSCIREMDADRHAMISKTTAEGLIKYLHKSSVADQPKNYDFNITNCILLTHISNKHRINCVKSLATQ
ncbi:hypothetical protein ENBRE01_0140 [Enteropsectra breve]|nr:hypothetical protein ENBRE01_0140 [Enteropsectra breve]